jgi:hypothetical protein
MDSAAIFALLVAFAYIILYIRGRLYKGEGFEDKKEKQEGYRNCATVLDTSLEQDKPYMTNQDQYGDFEQDVVYQNEGGRDTTQEAINMAKRRFPFDWSQLPPSSSLFQAQQALFVNEPGAMAAPFKKETFTDIESSKVLPPDGSLQEKEDDALKAYKAVATSDLKSVDQESVDKLIKRIYGDKGLIAKVAKKANNVFEVYEVQETNPKIIYEDDVATANGMAPNGFDPMVEPSTMLVDASGQTPIESGLAPTGRGQSMGKKRQEYSNYNPNLEGIFGPKMQWQQWG